MQQHLAREDLAHADTAMNEMPRCWQGRAAPCHPEHESRALSAGGLMASASKVKRWSFSQPQVAFFLMGNANLLIVKFRLT